VKYAEKIFSIRVSKRDGTSKVLKGLHGTPMLNEVIHVPVGKDDVLIAHRTTRCARPTLGGEGDLRLG